MHRFVSLAVPFTLALLLAACGAQKKTSSGDASPGGKKDTTATDAGPSAAEWRQGIKGKWVLNSVEREDIPAVYTIQTIFDVAPVDCFLGSVWDLPGGNYRGSITFRSVADICVDGTKRTIVWTVYDGKKEGELPQFQFKKIFGGERAKDVRSGYRLHLSYSDGESLVMRLPVQLEEGNTGHLVFTFSRKEEF